MDEHDRPAALQLIQEGHEPLVTEIDAARIGEHQRAVELEFVEGVAQLFKCAIHIRKREAGEATEPVGVLLYQLRGEFVHTPRQRPRAAIVPHMDAGGRDRRNGYINSRLVHERQHHLFGPGRGLDAADGIVAFIGLAPEELRQDVMMNVDRQCRGARSVRLWGGERPAAEHLQGSGGRGGAERMTEELATRKFWSVGDLGHGTLPERHRL
jgi:hypothetical protein